MAVLALPPVLPTLKHDFGLSESTVGTLTTLPVLLLALGAVGGSVAVARLGPRRALALGLVTVGAASGVRGTGGVSELFAGSVLLGLGIATLQPTMPSVAHAWFPARVALATSVYSNGIVVGEAVAASLTLPLVLPLTGSWQAALAVWGAPALVAAFLLAAPFASAPLPAAGEPRKWWPSWSHRLTWRVGLLQAGGSVLYFGSNAFVPTDLHAAGHASLVAPCLAALNTSQLCASVIVGVMARRRSRPHWLLAACGVAGIVALAGFLADPGTLGVAGCALVGICSAVTFVVALSLPPVLADPHDVHRMAAAASTISYVAAFVFPLAGGAVWDATGSAVAAFAPVALGGVLGGSVLFWPGHSAPRLARLRIS